MRTLQRKITKTISVELDEETIRYGKTMAGGRSMTFSAYIRQLLITTTKKTKSGRPRSVPLPDRSCSILPPFPGVDDFVLINPETKKRYVQMNKGFKAAVRRAGIEDVQWHDLRRTAGCRWLQRDGKSMEEASILLGHSSVQVTEQRYAFLESEKVAASISGRTKTGTAAAS